MGYDPNGTWNWTKITGWAMTMGIVVASAVAVVLIVSIPGVGPLASAAIIGAGVGALSAVSNSIESQGGLMNWSYIDPLKVAVSGLLGGLIGAASGALSYGFTQIISGFGARIGQALSYSYFQGVQIGKVFNWKVVEALGGLAGYTLGMIGANAFFDYSLNEITNNYEDVNSFWYDVLEMSGASFIIDFIRLFK